VLVKQVFVLPMCLPHWRALLPRRSVSSGNTNGAFKVAVTIDGGGSLLLLLLAAASLLGLLRLTEILQPIALQCTTALSIEQQEVVSRVRFE